jgi:hypothetical protein
MLRFVMACLRGLQGQSAPEVDDRTDLMYATCRREPGLDRADRTYHHPHARRNSLFGARHTEEDGRR